MKKLLLICMSVLFVSCKQQEQKEDKFQSLTNELNEISKKGIIHGFSVAIANEEKIVYEKGFGFSDIANKKTYNSNTLQKIGSVSKMFIGLSLLKAQELGKLNLDDPINQYLDFDVTNPNFPEEKITIRQLANHTSSITDTDFYDANTYVLKEDNGFNGIDIMKEVFKPSTNHTSMSDFLKKILLKESKSYSEKVFTNEKPGTKFNYTNVGAALGAYVLERATGETFPNFTKQYIFAPLKMTSSGWSYETVDTTKISNLYYGNTEVPVYRLQAYPDGGLYTSSHDLGLLLNELIKGQFGKGQLLKKENYQQLFGSTDFIASVDQFKKENPALSVHYNEGLFTGKTEAGNFGHTGGDFGLVSLFFFNAHNKQGRVLIVNTHVEPSDEELLNTLWSIWDKLDGYKLD